MLNESIASVNDCSEYTRSVCKGLSTTNQNCGVAPKLKKIIQVQIPICLSKVKMYIWLNLKLIRICIYCNNSCI